MLMTIVAIYTLFVLITMYTSIMQIGYVNQAKKGKAVLLSDSEFVKAGDYSVAKEKMSIASSFVDYILFIVWIDLGIKFLETNMYFEDEAVMNIAVVMGFLVINSIISLPFGYYEKFILDEKFGFNKSSMGQWIKDTLISFVMTLIFGSLVVWGIFLIITSFTLWWLWSFI
ncbi:MAG: M48 family peptidase, partial [Sulfurimonas sp.]|nr:M48 family peptidase [Sulfurimonas sp.]